MTNRCGETREVIDCGDGPVVCLAPGTTAHRHVRASSGRGSRGVSGAIAERDRARAAAVDLEQHLARVVERLTALCMDTDGNWLHPDAELPVGVFQEVAHDAAAVLAEVSQ